MRPCVPIGIMSGSWHFAGKSRGVMVVGEMVAANAQCLSDPFLGTKGVPLEVGAPCLQAPGETTMGVGAKAHFCAINDTHAQWKPFQMAVRKVKELAPKWRGMATKMKTFRGTILAAAMRFAAI